MRDGARTMSNTQSMNPMSNILPNGGGVDVRFDHLRPTRGYTDSLRRWVGIRNAPICR